MHLTTAHIQELDRHLYLGVYSEEVADNMPDDHFTVLSQLQDAGLLKFEIVNDDSLECTTAIMTTKAGATALRDYRQAHQARHKRYVEEALF